MTARKHRDISASEKPAPSASPAPGSTPSPKLPDTPLSRALRHIESGHCQKALDLLRSAGSEARVRNAIGVCCLRLGRVHDAVPLYRSLVLATGCTWVRENVPTVYKTNFATALLMSGHPSGCEEILADINDESHPSVRRLREAIKRWVGGLNFWQKLNWRFGRIEPKNCEVRVDFEPGELEEDVAIRPEGRPAQEGATGGTGT